MNERPMSTVSRDWAWLISRNPPSGKAELAIYSYSICVKRNVVVIIFINKMDFVGKATYFPGSMHTINTMCLILKYEPYSMYMSNYWHCGNDQTIQDS